MGSPELCPCQSFHPDSIPEILYISILSWSNGTLHNSNGYRKHIQLKITAVQRTRYPQAVYGNACYAKIQENNRNLYGRRLPDLLPSVGDSGSSSTNRTLVAIELPRPVGARRLELVRGAVIPARKSRLANGVCNGVAGVVDTWANVRARAARLDGEVM